MALKVQIVLYNSNLSLYNDTDTIMKKLSDNSIPNVEAGKDFKGPE